MKIEIDTLINLEDKEISIVFIPTIIFDKTRYFTCLYISWLFLHITITLNEYES